jgi:hypothetical protein
VGYDAVAIDCFIYLARSGWQLMATALMMLVILTWRAGYSPILLRLALVWPLS